jgi:hypothetical protein
MRYSLKVVVALFLSMVMSQIVSGDANQIPSKWKWLLTITGISPGLEAMHDPIVDVPFSAGEIWIVQVSNNKKQRLTADAPYRTPIFQSDGLAVIALRNEEVVRIPVEYERKRLEYNVGKPQVLGTIPGKGKIKIIGYNENNPDEILYGTSKLSEDGHSQTIGFFSVEKGKVTRSYQFPSEDASVGDEKSESLIHLGEHLRWWTRVYGDTMVDVRFSSEELGENPIEEAPVDVFYGKYSRYGKEQRNVSNCGGDICGQPSLSPDKQQVVFIRQSRK